MIGDKAIPGADPRKHEAGAEKRAVPNRSSPLAASWAEPSIPLFPMGTAPAARPGRTRRRIHAGRRTQGNAQAASDSVRLALVPRTQL